MTLKKTILLLLMISVLGVANNVKLLTKACDANDAKACTKLGVMYDNGKGVKQDRVKAKFFFGKACDLKNENGCKGYAILNQR